MEVFFRFSSKSSPLAFQAHLVELKTDHFKLMKGDYSEINFPILFKQARGKILNDILDTGCAGFFLISLRMKAFLKENNLTGWETFPIKLHDENTKEIDGYCGFSITGRCDSINYEKSKIIEKKLISTGPMRKYYKGIAIDQWDGMDFFSPEGTYQIFITKKAADALKKNKTTNMHLENLHEYEIDIRHVQKKE